MVYYTSTLSVECNSQAVLVFVIRRGVRAPFAFFDMSYYQALSTASREGAWEGEDAISEDDSSVLG